MMMERKKRSLPFYLGHGMQNHELWQRLSNCFVIRHEGPTVSRSNMRTIVGSQVTDSENHGFKASKVRLSSGDVGGPFYTTKKYCLGNPANTTLIGRNGPACGGTEQIVTYNGPIWPDSRIGEALFPFPTTIKSSDSALTQDGATAVSLVKPTNSVADLSTFLSELVKDGLPSIPLSAWESVTKSSIGSKLGGEWLNAQFGIAPVVKDMSKFLDGVRRADAILDQFERDAGRAVRRRFEFPIQKTYSTAVVYTGPQGPEIALPNSWYFGPPETSWELVRVSESYRRKWFSGAFTYHLPSDYDSRKELKRYSLLADKVFGLTFTPETLWELAPWSWAVDWFSNTGDVISNISSWANDDLVMRYGYLMEHTIVKDTYTKRGISGKSTGLSCGSISLITETKSRIRANPFGFGISWDGLSPYQLSIAAALGLTKK